MPIKPIERKRKFVKTVKPRNPELEKLLEDYGKCLDNMKVEAVSDNMWSFGPHMIPDFSHSVDAFEHVVDGFKPKKQ